MQQATNKVKTKY